MRQNQNRAFAQQEFRDEYPTDYVQYAVLYSEQELSVLFLSVNIALQIQRFLCEK